MNDLIFRQVRILDGSGGPEWIGDVSVRDGRINEVGTVTEGLVAAAEGGGQWRGTVSGPN